MHTVINNFMRILIPMGLTLEFIYRIVNSLIGNEILSRNLMGAYWDLHPVKQLHRLLCYYYTIGTIFSLSPLFIARRLLIYTRFMIT